MSGETDTRAAQADARPRPLGSRRRWLAWSLGGCAIGPAVARFLGNAARAADSPALIVRSKRPLDLETPVTALDGWLTPADRLFVRSHFGSPAVEGGPWRLEVDGLVDRPLRLGPDELAEGDRVSIPAVLQCAGNGRAFFRPRIPGVAWERGAVGQAEWSGVRLSDLLRRAGVKAGARHVHFLGADGPPAPKTPPFLRSIPLDRAMEPTTILATAMNGAPLPVLHGGPVRLVVPGWTGNHWMKWVRWITVSDVEAPGFYQQNGYKMPRTPAPPDAVLDPADLLPVTWMNVKSLITAPGERASLPAGPIEVRGVAWTGEGHVDRVDVAIGGEPGWRPATLVDPPRPGAWRRWRLVVERPPSGEVAIRSRATDSNGQVQPDATPWNRSGYLWNAIDQVNVKLG